MIHIGHELDLVSLNPEAKIVLTLYHGKHTYGELRFETGLSDRWLTLKIESMKRQGIIKKDGKWYGLSGKLSISAYELSLYAISQAKRMAARLAKLPCVRAIVLFGSVARKAAHEYSDLDLIIVASKPAEEVKGEVISEISKLESKYHIMIEPLILTKGDFLDNVNSQEGGIIYGIADGYDVLADKTGELAEILRDRVEEIRSSHEYLEEAGIWLRVK